MVIRLAVSGDGSQERLVRSWLVTPTLTRRRMARPRRPGEGSDTWGELANRVKAASGDVKALKRLRLGMTNLPASAQTAQL